MQRKISKKTIIIAVLIIFVTIISAFAISNAIQTNKTNITTTSISPYKYGLVVAYYGYWKSGDSYFADVDYPGQRKNIGKVPSEYAEFDLTFPTTLVEGNYEIDDIIDFRNYTGTWEDLNYNNISYNEFNEHYIEYASIWNPQSYIGEKNTEVTFTASFRLLNPPNQGLPGNKFAKDMGNGVYKCYIAVVIKYVDSDFVKDPDKWWRDHGGNPDDPGSGDITLEIEYRENTTTGRKLIDSKTINIKDGEIVNFNSYKVDDYICKGHFIMGQTTEYFYSTNVSFTTSKESYSKPVDGKLKTIFIYEKKEYVSIPKCTPVVYGDAVTVNIDMKKTDFERATDIRVDNAVFKIDDFRAGKDKDGNSVEGNHEFSYFDLYLKGYESSYDNFGKEVKRNLNIPKIKFIQSATNPNQYSTTIEATFAAFCNCCDGKPDSNGNYGMEVDKDNLLININLIENKPPEAYFDYYTEKKLENGSTSKLVKSYIGRETIIGNQASDPNGITDIRNVKYTLTDSSNNKYYINLLMLQDGMYFLESENVLADNIQFNGVTLDGDIKLVFKTGEKWNILQQVWDKDGAYQGVETAEIPYKSWYQRDITPEILDLRPKAVISDAIGYRYPIGEAFNGKQNRVVKYNSNSSYVAEFLQGTGVNINHNRDCWEIIPLDGQNIDNLCFDNTAGLSMIKESNILQIKYSILNNTKLMFKEVGKYKIRLQVTDTDGSSSEWAEKIIIIHKDLEPQIIANTNTRYYRNADSIANIALYNIYSSSSDYDNAYITFLGYNYDSDNDGDFNDETLIEIPYNNEGNIVFHTSNLGKYRFVIRAKENFGQETLGQYISDIDYKTEYKYLYTEVDNIAPTVTKFKIMTTDK